MLNFIRSDLAKLAAYTPNPGGEVSTSIDRLDANENPLDLPQELQEKLIWIYANELESNRYPDGSHSTLKQAIATYVNESANLDRQITPVNISVGNGSDELIRSLLIATCLQGEGSILVANPTFSMYTILAETLGIKTISVDRSTVDFQIDLAAAQQAIEKTKNPPIRVVFVVHPNSPTGNNLNAAELDWLRSLSEEILVVIDEAYFEFSRISVVKELSQRPNWIVLRTFSKAFRLAAYRVGYAIADPELINVLEKVRLPYNLPSFTIAAATVALNNRQLILPYVDKILEERAKLYQALSSISALKTWQSDANFLQVRFQDPDAGDRELANLTQALLDKGTLIRHTGGGLRITVGTPEENNRTIDRLKEIL